MHFECKNSLCILLYMPVTLFHESPMHLTSNSVCLEITKYANLGWMRGQYTEMYCLIEDKMVFLIYWSIIQEFGFENKSERKQIGEQYKLLKIRQDLLSQNY